MLETDYLVLGSGIAGLSFALHAAEHGRVVVVTKRAAEESNTNYAQGGIAAVLDPADIVRGPRRGHAHRRRRPVPRGHRRARRARTARSAVRELVDRFGAHFDRDAGRHARPGPRGRPLRAPRRARQGHHRPRDRARAARRRARARPTSRVLADHMAVDLLHARQVRRPRRLLRRLRPRRAHRARSRPSSRARPCSRPAAPARSTSTRPTPTSRPATAWPWPTAPAPHVANMEFIQFHPTCLFHPQAKSFLISEALRGEGGVLQAALAARPSWSATTR